MALRADHMQAAGVKDRLMAFLPLPQSLLIIRLFLRRRMLGQLRHHAAQDNVGAAARHVGGDGHRARHAGVGDDA